MKKKSTKTISPKAKSSKETVYIAGVNLSGLWSKKPIRAEQYYVGSGWWAAEGPLKDDVVAEKLGLVKNIGFITFASTNKQEVQCFIGGVVSSMTILKEWCWNS